MDGNCSLAPPVFDQLYVIRASLGTTCISCVYALLPGKSETVYTEMLEAVTDACTALVFSADPTTVVTDFEMTAMQAVTAGFGQQVHVQGCFFSRLCQSTWRRVQELGLTALYNEDDVAKHFVGMLDSLALLPRLRKQRMSRRSLSIPSHSHRVHTFHRRRQHRHHAPHRHPTQCIAHATYSQSIANNLITMT